MMKYVAEYAEQIIQTNMNVFTFVMQKECTKTEKRIELESELSTCFFKRIIFNICIGKGITLQKGRLISLHMTDLSRTWRFIIIRSYYFRKLKIKSILPKIIKPWHELNTEGRIFYWYIRAFVFEELQRSFCWHSSF